jgi:hypothetical protein
MTLEELIEAYIIVRSPIVKAIILDEAIRWLLHYKDLHRRYHE